ncbi:MAG TPA: hypothetical protein VJR27_01250 [Candidatus Saccharimonadales bacterium]|nr:hypothetical protein [Candidatus Saccharimonadales bacterium]
MKEPFRQSPTFEPYYHVGELPFVDEHGVLTTRPANYSLQFGSMREHYTRKLFKAAKESLQPDSYDARRQLSNMASYLTDINVAKYDWIVGTHVPRTPNTEAHLKRTRPEESEGNDIEQFNTLVYSRFGRGILKLARVPIMDETGPLYPPNLPLGAEIKVYRGIETVLGFSECAITTFYPLPPEAAA